MMKALCSPKSPLMDCGVFAIPLEMFTLLSVKGGQGNSNPLSLFILFDCSSVYKYDWVYQQLSKQGILMTKLLHRDMR